ncbi:MAG: DUF5107 domain-containing protein [Cellulosilyticaceae bacterium]
MQTAVKREYMHILGAELGECNPLPLLREIQQDKEILTNGSLKEAEQVQLGKNIGVRVLPYLMQNRYSRHKEELKVETLVLENDYLKATFLPGYGGRLFSLYNKELECELLFKNPVLQPSNIAIRDAWFSGGIEWNIGRIGHSVTTSDNLFVGIVKDDEGNEFIRMYEFERQNRLFWQIDIHLPQDAKELWTHVRIVNPDEEKKHLYWWTNIAVPLTEKTRVFSHSQEVFYIQPFDPKTKSQRYGHATLPNIPEMGEGDLTYPETINYGSEYFFQNETSVETPWEAAAYEDGHMFFECSTQPLRIRKMFTWGSSNGGKNWQDFLALPGQGDYLEIQAGFAPSQLHGYTIGGGETICFTQVFKGAMLDQTEVDYTGEDYNKVCKEVQEVVYREISPADVHKNNEKFMAYSEKAIEQIIYTGNGYGALESLRSGKCVPQGLTFGLETMKESEALWVEMLEHKTFPKFSKDHKPLSYMIDDRWEQIFEEVAPNEADNWAFWYYYGIFWFENGNIDKSLTAINQSLSIEKTAWASYAKAMIFERIGQTKGYLELLEEAYALGQSLFDGFVDKVMENYIKEGQYQKAYELYAKEKENDVTGKLLMYAAKAGLELGDMALADKLYESEVSTIREGENNYSVMWFEYYARKYALEHNVPYTEELFKEVTEGIEPPRHLDFRMNQTIRQ